jgi:hypothetical protein
MALDSDGRTLAYGFGEGSTGLMSVCPRSQRMVEVAADYTQAAPGSLFLTVRRLPTLSIVWETEIKAPNRASRPFRATGLSCRNRDGTDVLVATHFRGRTPHGEILRFRGEQSSSVFRGPADWVSFSLGDVAYVSGGRRVFAVDLATGRAEHVGGAPRGTGPFEVSPDGERIAAVIDVFGPRRSILLIDLRDGRAQVTPIRDENIGGSVIWLDKERILFSQIDGEEPISYVYDTSLRRVDTLVGWNADSMAVVSGVLYGLGSGQIHAVPVSGHGVEELGTFDSSELRTIVAVPPAPGLEIPVSGKVSPPPKREVRVPDESVRLSWKGWLPAAVIAAVVIGLGGWFVARRLRPSR